MNTNTITFYNVLKTYSFLIIALFFCTNSLAQQPEKEEVDSLRTTFSFKNLKLPNPNSIISKYTYDPKTDRYIYTESIGGFNIKYPLILTPQQFLKLVQQENLKNYYKEKLDALEGKKDGTQDQRKNLIPDFYVNSDFFSSIFGSDTISIRPQGSVELDLGFLLTRQDNPAFSPRNRSNFTFDFDQRISLSLLGKVGTRLQVTGNFDTEATFNFQNLIKLEYTPTEDDIIRKIEVGNVSLPLNSSLITGAQSLFGVKTELQFGKTSVTGIFSEQRSEARTVVAQGGGTLQQFDFFGLDYDDNRHYFLSQYFRDNYDQSLLTYPYINNRGLQITRIEVWVTNRSNRTDNIRNIVGLQDLGESNPNVVGSAVNILAGPNAFPDNSNNGFDPTNIGGAGSQLTEAIRDIATTQSGILVPGVNEGFDFSRLENARQLQQGTEFTLNTQLGYISLNQRLQNDEVLAVAFQFTVGDEVFQVGEFANDGVDATIVGENPDPNGPQIINNRALVLKTLKSSIIDVDQPTWDLMMKNIYNTGAFQLNQEDFRLNIFYAETSPVNFITPVGDSFGIDINGNPITPQTLEENLIESVPLLRLFNLDRFNFNGDPQENGDGFFDFFPGITVIQQNGKIIFTNIEPYGQYLFEVLRTSPGENFEDRDTYNPNQALYVYDRLYNDTKIGALEDSERNKFLVRGSYTSEGGGGGIPIGAFNVPQGSVTVTAGGRVLVEGIDYTVNYQFGTVQILDPALQASNVPIQISVEDNAVFGQQTRRFSGINIEHQFNENFVLGGTFINLSERPITNKATFNSEPINNTIFGINGNFSTELPFLTRLANKLPNIDTDAPSNLSFRGEFAYLLPGSPNGIDFNNESTAVIDDFEGTQNAIDLLSPIPWTLSSRPKQLGRDYTDRIGVVPGVEGGEDDLGLQNGFDRAHLNWYSIDPIFFSNQRPSGISDDDISDVNTRRVFIDEIFPQIDIVQGQTTVINTLDLVFNPGERGPYNMDPEATDNVLDNPQDSWAGITRQLTSTNFEQSNVEFIEFWLQDPFINNPNNPGGKLRFNLGNISEDILKDGRKQYENGLPVDGDISGLPPTVWGSVVPQEQSLVYAFSTTGQERTNQDVGVDGYDDAEEAQVFPDFAALEDPANDNYTFFLNTDGNIFERYREFNGLQGNTPDEFSNDNRGSTQQPDVEDVNRDNTLNTIDSYFEYELDITPSNLNPNNPFINDSRPVTVTLPNGNEADVTWYQFRVPLTSFTRAIGGITDIRSIRFIRMYLTEFTDNTVFRFGTLDLVRSDWRRYNLPLDDEIDIDNDNTEFNVSIIGIQENDGRYVSPPGLEREEVNNNNTVQRLNEQSLVVNACNLETEDSRAVFKNVNVDMRRYKTLRMFMHAESGDNSALNDGDAVGFIRMGNDFTQNYYQIEIPLNATNGNSTDPTVVWPNVNEINLPVQVLSQIKAFGISNGTLGNEEATFYDVIDGGVTDNPVPEFSEYVEGQQRVAIKGNPSFGDIRVMMLGIKNSRGDINICPEVWFNELRLSEIDNEGGWAAVASLDANVADFLNISATGRRSTSGFGSIEQGPNERSLEDVSQYDFVTNINLGQLLPKKWGINLPVNYGQSEQLITPEYDQQFKDIKLDDRLRAAQTSEERETIREQSEDYTKRQSINVIGLRKERTGDKTPRFYDVENLTLNFSYNQTDHRDFEIEDASDQNITAGINYNFNFNPISIEPFKNKDSLFTGKYWKLLKDFNLNLLPSSFSVNTNLNRQFNRQKFRDLDLGGNNIPIEELFRRNYTFDFQYAINYDLSKNLRFNYTASNNNIIRNYFIDDNLNGEQDPTLDIWDGFFDFGDPNRQSQQLQVNYQIPIDKIPTFSFLTANYVYTGNFTWQKGSDLFGNLNIDGQTFDLGNTIQNSSSHTLNATLDLQKLYNYVGLKKRTRRTPTRTSRGPVPPGPGGAQNRQNAKPKTSKFFNTAIDVLTSLKRLQVNYTENRGTFLPGYLETPGFIGTLQPTLGFTFGSQRDVRAIAARNGLLTVFPDFNQQFTQTEVKNLDFSGSVEFTRDLKIDITGGRTYARNLSENFNTIDLDNDGLSDQFNSLIQNTFGNFNISTSIIRTAFSRSDENGSRPFDEFRANRLTVARRLAQRAGINLSDPNNFVDGDTNGFPIGFGPTNQAVLIPSFLSAYTGQSADRVSLRAFRDVPIPNWNLRYSGFMKFKWFKKNFKRFSVSHGYNSAYTINQFRTNLDFEARNPNLDSASQSPNVFDQAGNFKNETLFSNINLTESFSPLLRVDFEMKNSLNFTTEVRKDRLLSLSFDNNLLTEVQTDEYTLGVGYRFKDVRIRSQWANNASKIIKSDLDMKLDVSVRDNKTIIRFLDLDNNQVTAGQTIWSLKYNANYAFSKNLTGIFFFDYQFSEFAISTAFPQTTIRTGLTLRYNFGN